MRFTKIRSSSGIYLVEILVSLIVGAMIAFTLLNTLTQTMRQGTTSQNELVANAVANELAEYVSRVPYGDPTNIQPGTLLSFSGAGPTPLLINRTTAGQVAAGPRPGPVGLDLTSYKWTAQSTAKAFSGTAQMSVDANTNPLAPSSLLVTIQVSWTDSSNLGTSGPKIDSIISRCISVRNELLELTITDG